MPYVYILKCADATYYTGSTWHLEQRVWEHNEGGGANFTKKRLPVELVYVEEFERVEEAFLREKQIQGWCRRKKEALMNQDWEKLQAYSRTSASALPRPSTSSGSDNADAETHLKTATGDAFPFPELVEEHEGRAEAVPDVSKKKESVIETSKNEAVTESCPFPSTGSGNGQDSVAAQSLQQALQQADDYNLHGLLFQHIELCETRSWLHYHRIDCAHLNRHMQAGLLVHETHYGGEAAQALAGFGIKPDMLDFAKREVSEVKKSKSNEAASVGQLRFYLAVLERATGQVWTGVLRYPQSRRTKRVAFDEAQRAAFVQAVQRIVQVIGQLKPPAKVQKPLCADCSYRMVCWQESTEDGDF